MKQIFVALAATVAALVWSPTGMAATGFSQSGAVSATSGAAMTPEVKSKAAAKPKAAKKKKRSTKHR